MKPLRHFTHPYLLNPTHPITIIVCGAGGTGSQVISGLAKTNYALIKLGHPGFNVTVYDGDQVSPFNIGRQLFSEYEIGQNKAAALVSRLNRFFGTRWLAKPHHFNEANYRGAEDGANVLMTCVDSVQARKDCFHAYYKFAGNKKAHPYMQELYWMDFGNGQSSGQVVLGTVLDAPQPKGEEFTTVGRLPHLFERYPEFYNQVTENNEPSCSTMEALGRQDLFINTMIANLGMDIFFRMFRQGGLPHQGVFFNLPELITAKINLEAPKPEKKTKVSKSQAK